MDYIQQLIQQMRLESELEDMQSINDLRKEIEYYNKRYLIRFKDKEYEMADQIQLIINTYKEMLNHAIRHFDVAYGSKVSQTQSAGGKKVFILKR